MKIAIVVNGISLDKGNFYKNFLPLLKQDFSVEVFETRSANDAVSLASKATDKRFEIVLAAGGDGTINQVVNGVLQGRENHADLPVLGAIPLGTGNDLAKGLGLRSDVDGLRSLLKEFVPKKLDVGKVIFTTPEGKRDYHYFVNVVDIGMGPEVVKKVMSSDRILGSEMAYYRSILSTFFTFKPMVVSATTEAWNWKGKIRTLAVANSKYYGHGLCIAPAAKPDDGIFEIFICGNASVMDFVLQSRRMKHGLLVRHSEVQYRRAGGIDLSSESPCAIEADGEYLGFLPAKVNMIPLKLKFLY